MGSDGFHGGFYQNTWETTGESLFKFVKDIFETSQLLEGVNDTSLVLIPPAKKKKHYEFVSQFRPSSLCNVYYKVITKTLSNRLKKIMQTVVGPNQSSFVLGVKDGGSKLSKMEAPIIKDGGFKFGGFKLSRIWPPALHFFFLVR